MNNIQKYRGLKNISQREFAAQLKITRPGLSFIEHSNVKYISPDVLNKMSEILEVSPIMLLGVENFKIVPETKEDIDYMIEILEAQREKL